MNAREIQRSRRGFSLVELLVVTVVFGIIVTAALGFMTAQHRAFSKGSDQLMAMQNLRYAYQSLDMDLSALGSNVPAMQPSLVVADDDVIAFTGDYSSNVMNDVSAVFIDPDAPTGMVQVPSSAVTIPNTSYSWPDTTYQALGGTPSLAELIIFFFASDTSTARTDDYVLHRQVNDGVPEVLSRNLLKQGTTPFFRYFRERTYAGASSTLDSIGAGELPLFHSTRLHGSAGDSAASAKTDSVRAVRVSFRSSNGRPGLEERFADLSRVVDFPNAGITVTNSCGDQPLLGSDLTLQIVTVDGVKRVRITWSPATDETTGERDVIRYVLYRRPVPNGGTWGDPFLSIPAGAGSYVYDDATVNAGSTYQYVHAAQDCTPSLSPMSLVRQITVS